jgi:hypothetical protein
MDFLLESLFLPLLPVLPLAKTFLGSHLENLESNLGTVDVRRVMTEMETDIDRDEDERRF